MNALSIINTTLKWNRHSFNNIFCYADQIKTTESRISDIYMYIWLIIMYNINDSKITTLKKQAFWKSVKRTHNTHKMTSSKTESRFIGVCNHHNYVSGHTKADMVICRTVSYRFFGLIVNLKSIFLEDSSIMWLHWQLGYLVWRLQADIITSETVTYLFLFLFMNLKSISLEDSRIF